MRKLSAHRKKIYRAAIVGCGRIGCTLDNDPKRKDVIWTHAGAYSACRRTKLVALVDVDAQARQWASERWRVKRTFSNLNELLHEMEIDILSICTPSSSHAPLFQQAASAAVPAIWCEKPMTRTLVEAKQILDLSRRVITSVNHTRRWDKAYEIARESIQMGRLGHPLRATLSYTNGIANMGSHALDILRYLLGDAVGVLAARLEDGTDPTLSGTIFLQNGAFCQLIGYPPGHAFLFEIDILGSEGRLRIYDDGNSVEFAKATKSPRYSGYREFSKPKRLWQGQDSQRMVKAVGDLVQALDHRSSTRCTARDGFKAVELVSALFLSAKTKSSVALPLKGEQRSSAIPVR